MGWPGCTLVTANYEVLVVRLSSNETVVQEVGDLEACKVEICYNVWTRTEMSKILVM